MCKLCDMIKNDNEYKERFSNFFQEIRSRLNSGVAFSNIQFPFEVDFPFFEPRMPLQIPSNFYQPVFVDGTRLRCDWSSGWIRAIGFVDGIILITHAFSKNGEGEKNIYFYLVKFDKEDVNVSLDSKIVISVNCEKDGKNLITGEAEKHRFSFTFTHQPTEKAMARRDRVMGSSLVKRIYHGKIPQKPLVFDWTEYVVTVPHFAPHSFLHQNFSKYGFSSAMEMQNAVTDFLREHLTGVL